MKNIHMFGISTKNGVKKHFIRPEKWHGFGPGFYCALHPNEAVICTTCCIDLLFRSKSKHDDHFMLRSFGQAF